MTKRGMLSKADLERKVADGDIDRGSVLADHRSVKRERHRKPLILLDSAVDMAVEINKPALLVERFRLEIEPRRIGMTAYDLKPGLGDPLSADDGRHDRTAFITAINLVTRFKFFKRRKLLKTLRLKATDALGITQALGLRGAEIFHVFFTIFFKRQIFHFHTNKIIANTSLNLP